MNKQYQPSTMTKEEWIYFLEHSDECARCGHKRIFHQEMSEVPWCKVCSTCLHFSEKKED